MRRTVAILTFLTMLLYIYFSGSVKISCAGEGGQVVTLRPVADAYVDPSSPDLNHGREPNLLIRHLNLSYGVVIAQIAYLRFDLTKIPSKALIKSATLTVHVSWIASPTKLHVHLSPDSSWDEYTLTWRNAPTYVESPLYSVALDKPMKFYALDVSEAVKQSLPNGKLTLVLSSEETPGVSDYIQIGSREAPIEDHRPTLQINYWIEATSTVTSITTASTTTPTAPGAVETKTETRTITLIEAPSTIQFTPALHAQPAYIFIAGFILGLGAMYALSLWFKKRGAQGDSRQDLNLSLLAFAVPAAVRLIPEAISYPYPIGYDTLMYAYALVDFKGWLILRGLVPPLLILLLQPFSRLLGPFLTLKAGAVAMYGLMGSATYTFARRALKWNAWEGFLASLILSLQFVSLRVSWDLHRNMLGMVLLIYALSWVPEASSRRGFTMILLLSTMVLLAHEASTGILFFTILLVAGLHCIKRRFREAGRLMAAASPVVTLALIASLVSLKVLNLSSIAWLQLPIRDYSRGYEAALKEAGYTFLLIYPLLIPLIPIGIFRNGILASWTLASLGMGFSWIIYPQLALANWSRLLFLLVYPFAFYAAKGAHRLVNLIELEWFRLRMNRWISLLKPLLLLTLITPHAALAWGFMTYSTENPYPYFNNPYLWKPHGGAIPSSMLSNTAPLSDTPHIIQALTILNSEMDNSSALLVHEAFLGYAHLYLDRDRNIIPYGKGKPVEAAKAAYKKGYRQIYLIWWSPGLGWHPPEPDLTHFAPRLRSGRIIIYLYTP